MNKSNSEWSKSQFQTRVETWVTPGSISINGLCRLAVSLLVSSCDRGYSQCLERVVRSWVKLISDQFSFRFLILTVRSVDPLCYVLSVASFVLHIMIVLWCIFHFSVHSKKTPFRQWSCVTTSPCSASTKRRSSSSFTFPSHPTSSGLLLTPRSKDTERWGNHPFCSFSPLSLREVKSVFKLASDERTNNDGWDHRRNNLPHGASELVHSSHE